MPRSLLLALVALVVLAPACREPVEETAPSAGPTSEAEPDPGPARSAPAAVPSTRVAEGGEVEPFEDPARLADELVDAETAIRDPDVPTEELQRPAWVQQQAYRDLVEHPDWRDPVRARVPERLRAAFDANLRATVELRRLTEPREELPDWTIVAPPPADELRSHYEASQAEFGVDWSYLAAIHLVESRMGRIRGDSVAGAQGPMQFLPSTWEAYGEGDIHDYRDAILAAGRYLAAHGAPDDMDRALYAYNHSDRYVAAIQEHARVMRADPLAYRAYYHWRVYYRLTTGDVVLEEGWPEGG